MCEPSLPTSKEASRDKCLHRSSIKQEEGEREGEGARTANMRCGASHLALVTCRLLPRTPQSAAATRSTSPCPPAPRTPQSASSWGRGECCQQTEQDEEQDAFVDGAQDLNVVQSAAAQLWWWHACCSLSLPCARACCGPRQLSPSHQGVRPCHASLHPTNAAAPPPPAATAVARRGSGGRTTPRAPALVAATARRPTALTRWRTR